jgi:hypothetical protein
LKIYIAGPYSNGDTAINVRTAMFAWDYITATLGHAAYCPHLSHFQHMVIPHEYEFWMEQDIFWLKQCDAILRLEGESSGADRELQIAIDNGLTVYHSVFEIPNNKKK